MVAVLSTGSKNLDLKAQQQMNEYRFTGIDRNTGDPVVDVMRAESEDDVREAANARGIEIKTIGLKPLPGNALSSFLLGFGQLVSLVGCALPLVYPIGTEKFSALGFAASIIGAIYSAAMFVVFLRVKQI